MNASDVQSWDVKSSFHEPSLDWTNTGDIGTLVITRRQCADVSPTMSKSHEFVFGLVEPVAVRDGTWAHLTWGRGDAGRECSACDVTRRNHHDRNGRVFGDFEAGATQEQSLTLSLTP